MKKHAAIDITIGKLAHQTGQAEHDILWDYLWDAEARVSMFQESMFPNPPREYPPSHFCTKEILFTSAFSSPQSNIAIALAVGLPTGLEGKEILRARMRLAAAFVAMTANAALEGAAFDYTTLPPNPPLNSDCVAAAFQWLEFKPHDFRFLENEYGLREGEAKSIVNALETTAVYEGSKPGETFLRVASAADLPNPGERDNICTSLAEKCSDVLFVLNATGSWCQSCERGAGIAECKSCHDHYLLDGGLLVLSGEMPRHLLRDKQSWQSWRYSDYVCWQCRTPAAVETMKCPAPSDPTRTHHQDVPTQKSTLMNGERHAA